MMMTALACKVRFSSSLPCDVLSLTLSLFFFSQDKIAFASVHDSYWTHACSVDEMSVLLRDTFIELHSQDILGKLRQEVRRFRSPSSSATDPPSQFIQRYAGHVVPVSKVPAGISYTTKTGQEVETRLADSDAPAEASAEILEELEEEDGDGDAPLFAATKVKTPKPRGRPKKVKVESSDDAEVDEEEEDEAPKAKKMGRPKTIKRAPVEEEEYEDVDPNSPDSMAKFWKGTASKSVGSKLVFLADILPPVPSKGDFDLERIRNSLYFFS